MSSNRDCVYLTVYDYGKCDVYEWIGEFINNASAKWCRIVQSIDFYFASKTKSMLLICVLLLFFYMNFLDVFQSVNSWKPRKSLKYLIIIVTPIIMLSLSLSIGFINDIQYESALYGIYNGFSP